MGCVLASIEGCGIIGEVFMTDSYWLVLYGLYGVQQ